MIRFMILVFLFVMIVFNLYSQYAVDETRSMNAEHMEALRESCDGGDNVMSDYWWQFKELRNEGDNLLVEDRGNFDPWGADPYVTEAIWGAIGIDMPPDTEPADKLEKSRKYLLVPDDPYEDYLDLNLVWDRLQDTDDAVRYELALINMNTAHIVDMLWDYAEEDRIAMCEILDSLADSLHYHLDRTKDYWGLGEQPIFPWEIKGMAALGYAGSILGDNYGLNGVSHRESAKYLLFEYPIPHLVEEQYGFLDFVTTRANYIGEGAMYFADNSYTQLGNFFTANLRMYNENLYDEDIVVNTMKNVINYVGPDLKSIMLNDIFRVDRFFMIKGLFEYYYNNSNEIADNEIRWYFDWYSAENPYGNHFPKLGVWSRYYHPIFSFNPDKTISIDGAYTIPETIANGSYSDEELTIFRPEISSISDFTNSISMYVNYDNSLNPSYHSQGDQSSFQLYAYGQYLLIDPGYMSATFANSGRNAKEWHKSPYAHNLIIVNPDSINEHNYLQHHYHDEPGNYSLSNREPGVRNLVDFSDPSNIPDVECPNPSFKEYFISNESIEKLKINLDYVSDPIGDDIIEVNRNFYFIDDESFIIVDKINNQNSTQENLYS